MSRTDPGQRPFAASQGKRAEQAVPGGKAITAEEIAVASLELAKRARAAGLTGISYLLETAALQAGAEAAAGRWPADAPER